MSHEHQARLQAYNPLTWPAGAVDTPCIPSQQRGVGRSLRRPDHRPGGSWCRGLAPMRSARSLCPAGGRTATSACAWTRPAARGRLGCWWWPRRCCWIRWCRSRTAPCCYELVTGHPDRTAKELVFLADLAVELRAWPADTWGKGGGDPEAGGGAVVGGGGGGGGA